ncbi:hypothetical protein [Streptomyces sp. BPTC-684]|nr:hypothetical protein [Streptomyces sp. BPTC-684]WHM40903.1 hypothetical protein QIY60_31165 [Streptomyces sp. BPTC-684]
MRTPTSGREEAADPGRFRPAGPLWKARDDVGWHPVGTIEAVYYL